MTDTVTTPTITAGLYNWQRDALNRAGLRIVASATEELVTLEEAAEHLRIEAYGSPAEYPEATLIEALITAAREYVEHETGLILAPQTLELSGRSFYGLCRWPGDLGIPLRTAPVSGILSVAYIDGDGVTQTLANDAYILDDVAQVPALFPAYGVSAWPASRDQVNSVRIQFVAGYSRTSGSPTTAIIPQLLRSAILLMTGHLFENREETTRTDGGPLAQIPLGISSLIQRYTIRNGFA